MFTGVCNGGLSKAFILWNDRATAFVGIFLFVLDTDPLVPSSTALKPSPA